MVAYARERERANVNVNAQMSLSASVQAQYCGREDLRSLTMVVHLSARGTIILNSLAVPPATDVIVP